MARLVLNTNPRKGKGAVYNLEGSVGNIYFPESIFNGSAPSELELSGAEFQTGPVTRARKAAMSPEEKKAAADAAKEARKNLTPLEKALAARKRAAKELEKAEKLEAASAVPA